MEFSLPGTMGSIFFSALRDGMGVLWRTVIPLLSYRSLVVLLLVLNLKSLHFMWHIRFLRTFIRRLTDPTPTHTLITPACTFLPAITSTRSPLLECDYNLHKSNSTYFTDLDMARGNLGLLLFRQLFDPIPGRKTSCIMVLGGAQCVWRKEIKPYQGYEVWTRLLSWDDKWIYVVGHFVVKGRYMPVEYVLQPGKMGSVRGKQEKGKGGVDGSGEGEGKEKEGVPMIKSVFASSVSRYVFKNGRKTVPPHEVLRGCGLLPSGTVEGDGKGEGMELEEEIERLRKKWLPVAQLQSGWDDVHGLFDGEQGTALGRYTDLLWR